MAEPLAEDLPIGVELVAMDERSYTFKLSLGKGAALLHATRRMDSPLADASFSSDTAREGARFWQEVARWLRIKVPATSKAEPPARIPVAVLSLGQLERDDGVDWRALKVMLGGEDRAAELYLNVAIEEDRGVLVEKDPSLREDLVRLLRSALGSVAQPSAARAKTQSAPRSKSATKRKKAPPRTVKRRTP
jgi:hypothetical protein